MAPVRRLRSLAWMKARKLPGVRCSTLKTECRSLLCLITMPGRSWVAGIAMLKLSPNGSLVARGAGREQLTNNQARGTGELSIVMDGRGVGNRGQPRPTVKYGVVADDARTIL